MRTETIYQDFLAGQNGAVQLTEADLGTLDDLYVEISSKRFSDDCTPLAKVNTQFFFFKIFISQFSCHLPHSE